MNKPQLQEKLQHFISDDETIHVEMYLQYEGENGSIDTYLPALEEDTLSPALGKLVTKQIKNKFFNKNEDYEYEVVSAHTAEANNRRQVFHESAAKIPKAAVIFDAVEKNTAQEFPKTEELGDAWAYIFKVTCSSGTIYLWKRNYSFTTLRKEVSYSLFFKNSKLSLFDKDLFRLSNHFDVMYIATDLIIVNRSEFEKAFDYVEAMQTSANVNVNAIKKTKLVDAAGMLKIAELAKNKTTLRKLLNINPDSKILLKEPKQIARLAKRYKVKFEITEDETQLSINTKKAAVAFVEMLNDDFLLSEFSGSKYKIKGKSQIKD